MIAASDLEEVDLELLGVPTEEPLVKIGIGQVEPLWVFRCEDEIRSRTAVAKGIVFVAAMTTTSTRSARIEGNFYGNSRPMIASAHLHVFMKTWYWLARRTSISTRCSLEMVVKTGISQPKGRFIPRLLRALTMFFLERMRVTCML